jgi:hypothetical protein
LWDFAKADVCFAREPTDHSSTANPQTWDERLCDQYLHFMLEDIDTPARFLLEESEKWLVPLLLAVLMMMKPWMKCMNMFERTEL